VPAGSAASERWPPEPSARVRRGMPLGRDSRRDEPNEPKPTAPL